MNEKKTNFKISYKVDPSAENGTYSNSATIFHNETEFLFDFGFSLPGNQPVVKINSRIITSPQSAYRFLKALNENIKRYEDKFGPIQDSRSPQNFGEHPTDQIIN